VSRSVYFLRAGPLIFSAPFFILLLSRVEGGVQVRRRDRSCQRSSLFFGAVLCLLPSADLLAGTSVVSRPDCLVGRCQCSATCAIGLFCFFIFFAVERTYLQLRKSYPSPRVSLVPCRIRVRANTAPLPSASPAFAGDS